jgi:hypothetical protein
MEVDFDDNRNQIIPMMSDLIKAYSEEKRKRTISKEMQAIEREGRGYDNNDHGYQDKIQAAVPPPTQHPLPPQPAVPQITPMVVESEASEEAPQETEISGGANPNHNRSVDNVSTRPRQNVGTYKEGPAIVQKLPMNGEEYEFAFNIDVINKWEQPIPVVSNTRHITKDFHPNQKLQKKFLAECYLLQDKWFDNPACVNELSDHFNMDTWDMDGIYFNEIVDQRILKVRRATKGSKYNKDNPSFNTAMRGPFQAKFWQAMQVELHTLIKEFDCWDYVPNPGKNVLPSTWAFKMNRYPDGRVKKFKA